MFREGRTKAVGNVNKIITYVPAIVAKEPKKTGGQQLRGDGKKRQQGSGHRDPLPGQAGQLQQPVQA